MLFAPHGAPMLLPGVPDSNVSTKIAAPDAWLTHRDSAVETPTHDPIANAFTVTLLKRGPHDGRAARRAPVARWHLPIAAPSKSAHLAGPAASDMTTREWHRQRLS